MVVSAFPTKPSIHNLIEDYGVDPVQEMIAALSPEEAQELFYDWDFWARTSQLPPNWPWTVWLQKSGRGSGKTRSGAEFIRRKSDTTERMHLVGRTAADVRDVMVEGESGILAISPPWNMPKYEPSKRRLVWPNGAKALCFSADEPSLLRGPQCGAGWCDELASWRYVQETWDNFMFGLRLGEHPQAVVTTTPRPIKLIKKLTSLEGQTVHVTTDSTYANKANLAPSFFTEIISQYEGTRLGAQEIGGQILDDNPDALWNTELIDETRVSKFPELDYIVVAVDPSVKENPTAESSETGIVVAGRKGRRGLITAHGYVLDDLSILGGPSEWVKQAISAYYKYKANCIVAESNNGGALIKNAVHAVDPDVPVELVTATRGKQLRAEPIAMLYDQRRVHHVGMFPALETQMCEWVPGDKSPDRLDANVWALTYLLVGEKARIVTSV